MSRPLLWVDPIDLWSGRWVKGAENRIEGKKKMEGLRCYQRSGEHLSWKAWSSLPAIVSIVVTDFVVSRLHTFELALAERRSIASNDDELGFA